MRIESVAALEKIIRNVLSVLGLMPTSYSEVKTAFSNVESSSVSQSVHSISHGCC